MKDPVVSGKLPVRPGLRQVLSDVWRRLGFPGTWWTAGERLALARQVRAASGCDLCARRKQELSPSMVAGRHEADGPLPDILVDTVHRIVTDATRLTPTWYGRLVSAHISPGHYVEVIGVVAATLVVDTFARALGADAPPLPEPVAGQPTRETPAGAIVRSAWIPTVPTPGLSHVQIALSLVPAEKAALASVSAQTYRYAGALAPAQVEQVAAVTSAFNDCFY